MMTRRCDNECARAGKDYANTPGVSMCRHWQLATTRRSRGRGSRRVEQLDERRGRGPQSESIGPDRVWSASLRGKVVSCDCGNDLRFKPVPAQLWASVKSAKFEQVSEVGCVGEPELEVGRWEV